MHKRVARNEYLRLWTVCMWTGWQCLVVSTYPHCVKYLRVCSVHTAEQTCVDSACTLENGTEHRYSLEICFKR